MHFYYTIEGNVKGIIEKLWIGVCDDVMIVQINE